MSSEMLKVQPTARLRGSLEVPGDKSISHRCLLLGALAQGVSRFKGLSEGQDVQSTASCLQQLGVTITTNGDITKVTGVGLHGLQAPKAPLDCGNSGTTLRLLMGVLAAQPFSSTLVGDNSLSGRPMTRVSDPLMAFGAQLQLTQGRFAPLHISPAAAPLTGGPFSLAVASAQVKSALLLAGLYTHKPVSLFGRIHSRDHTEKMLPDFGVTLTTTASEIVLPAGQVLTACEDFTVPGDPSSAAFWLAAAALVPHSTVTVKNVSLNPTRIGFFEVLKRMGAAITWELTATQAEPVGDVHLTYHPLTGVSLNEADIPYLVDEVPLIALLATQAQGTTTVRGAQELRIKECDRLAAMETNLKAMGIQGWKAFEDGFEITGVQTLNAAHWESFHDHRIAMVGVLAGLIAQNNHSPHQVLGAESIAVSYPAFLKDLAVLQMPQAEH